VEALTQAGASLSPAAWREHLRAAAEGAAISPALLEALVWQESRWRPQAVSSAGLSGWGN
jgi:soluble lytic murein transglycosylase-like protein